MPRPVSTVLVGSIVPVDGASVAVALRTPVAVGAKVVLKLQFVPEASVASAQPPNAPKPKSPGFTPPASPVSVTDWPELFVTVICCAELVVPSS